MMEISCSISWTIFFHVVIAILTSTLFLKYKIVQNKIKKRLPPGEMGLPWIGETIDFFKAQRNNTLFEEFVQPRMIKYGNIFKTRLMGSPTIVVNGAEANKFFLSNEFKLVISSWPTASVQLMGKNSIMEKQGEQHRRIRGLIATTLSNSGLENLVPKMCKAVELHLEKDWNGIENDIISLYHSAKALTFTIMFECLLGIKVEGIILSTFERILDGVFAQPICLPGSRFSRAMKARKEVEKMLGKVVREKRKEMEDGLPLQSVDDGMLLSQLVGGMIRGEIREEEVIDNVVLLVFAAHDTTSFSIAMIFKMLAHHSDCYALLLQEQLEIMKQKTAGDEKLSLEDTKKMKYTWQVARETMRLFPPIFGSFRKAITDIQYQGFIIPKGWKVLWTTYGTHYNEEHFRDAMSFNPSRFEEAIAAYVYLPFGGGPRLCVGYHLAKLNILIFVHYVVTHYDWSLAYPNEKIIMDPLPFPSHGTPIKISPKVSA